MDSVTILAIETSCDETAAAVVRNGREVLSNVIHTQIPVHALYGGVVPEIASRKHMERINPVIEKALSDAGTELKDVDAVAVTYGPGLVGALLVGVAEAKALAFAAGKPLIGVNHIEGHICANYIEHKELKPPYLGLVVSGGHTHLFIAENELSFKILGRTVDDAAGEAFDKVARAIGLGYPGGPKIDALAKEGNPDAIPLPKAKVSGQEYSFSFSGLKSAVLNLLMKAERSGQEINKADLAASFQKSVCSVLTEHAVAAAREYGLRDLALAGGVAANSCLRATLSAACLENDLNFYVPSPIYCTDNAAMIGAAAYFEYMAGKRSGLDLNAVPGLGLGER